MKQKLSPYHDGAVKPMHKGVYQRRIHYYVRYARWDGRYWYISGRTAAAAEKNTMQSGLQNLPWRGVLK